MKKYALRSDRAVAPPEDFDVTPRMIRVHVDKSLEFIRRSCAVRQLRCSHFKSCAGIDITVHGTAAQVDEVRDEFNTRPLVR